MQLLLLRLVVVAVRLLVVRMLRAAGVLMMRMRLRTRMNLMMMLRIVRLLVVCRRLIAGHRRHLAVMMLTVITRRQSVHWLTLIVHGAAAVAIRAKLIAIGGVHHVTLC